MHRIRISIHVLREEDDKEVLYCETETIYFNPRPPRGGRPYNEKASTRGIYISIHVLREEDDSTHTPRKCMQRGFQSTSSARRTTAGR